MSMRVISFCGGFMSMASICAAAPPVPTAATESLLTARPGLRAIATGGSLSALYGVPIAEDSNPSTDTRDFVDWWLFDDGGTGNKDTLGVDGVTLVFERTETLMNGKFEVLTYRQSAPSFAKRRVGDG